jgi:uncharacterized protein YaaQ
MGFLEKLKEIVHVDVDAFIKVNCPEIHNHFKIVKDEKSKDKVKVNKDVIEINHSALEKEEWGGTKKLLGDFLREENAVFLEQKADERVDDIKETSNSRKIKDVLSFYTGKIRADHFKALEASLYLRTLFQRHAPTQEIERMKLDIIHEFGTPGKNISNLCSSGYFEGHIRDLYEEMSRQEDFSNDKFREKFEKIVNEAPFTVFVSQRESKSAFKNEINAKLKKFRNYGIGYLSVHGIGPENVKKVQEIIDEITAEREDIEAQNNVENNIVQARLTIKK